jgi:hypothetical protein
MMTLLEPLRQKNNLQGTIMAVGSKISVFAKAGFIKKIEKNSKHPLPKM